MINIRQDEQEEEEERKRERIIDMEKWLLWCGAFKWLDEIRIHSHALD